MTHDIGALDRARDLAKEFETRLADILRSTGADKNDDGALSRSIIRLTEPDSLDLSAIDMLRENAERLTYLVDLAAGRQINTLAIAPVPVYMEATIPLFEQYFDKIILCDNYKTGKIIGQCDPIIELDALLDIIESVDCVLIGTVDQRIRGIFAERLPPEKTINLHDVLENVARSGLAAIHRAESIAAEIRTLDNPFVILCHSFAPPYISFLKGLDEAGYDVVILSRLKENGGLGTKRTDLRTLGARAIYGISLVESLHIGQILDDCPWWLLNDGFLHASWSFKRAAWHYAYTAALLEMIRAPRILCLYDPIKPARADYDYEHAALLAYTAAVRRADGLHIGCASPYLVEFIVRATGAECPAIGFLRYNLPPKRKRPPRNENLSLALVSPIAAEVPDPGTDLRGAVRELLRAGIDIHYYIGSPESEMFKKSLPLEEARHLFIHETIIDQEELVAEISKCHAGWCVANLGVFDEIVVSVKSDVTRDLYSLFPRTTVPSRALAFGAAGLPVVYNSVLHEVERIFPKDCAIPFDFSQAEFVGEILRRQNWPELWRAMDNALDTFKLATHFPRFLRFLNDVDRFAAKRAKGTPDTSSLARIANV